MSTSNGDHQTDLKFGLIWSFRNPEFARIPWEDLYHSHLDLIVESEALGFDYAWLTEHHFLDDGYSPSMFSIAGAIAARTERLRIGTFVLVLPLHNPVDVAENTATLDLISKGRFELGVGLGSRRSEFDDQGLPHDRRGARLEEGLTVIRRLLSGERVTFDGKFTKLRDVRITPPAAHRPHERIWLAGVAPTAIDRAARLGCHFAGSGARDLCNAYDTALATHGRIPTDHYIAGQQMIYVAPTREQAWEIAAPLLRYHTAELFRYVSDGADDRELPYISAIPTVEEIIGKQQFDFLGEQAIIGTPQDVIAKLEEYVDQARITHLICNLAMPGMTVEQIRAGMELFAAEVIPHFRVGGDPGVADAMTSTSHG